MSGINVRAEELRKELEATDAQLKEYIAKVSTLNQEKFTAEEKVKILNLSTSELTAKIDSLRKEFSEKIGDREWILLSMFLLF